MAGTIITELGRITIDEDILANIAGYAATENYGVVGMKPRTATDTFLQLVGNDTNRKRGGCRSVCHHGLWRFLTGGGKKYHRQCTLSGRGNDRH